ncbi:hypothetical protein B0H67DRAFT_677606 [Lasiosphaeris hirsuta]|uniref:Uncharacterized protein n=1 Tax=Lasiosphaeris hirsuta TaxID=260670 RepID=A0AA40B8M4_9PEZI|nr:hypothetical protein B0H67DRAFT_677606 [Lasiosphaeris hirsuta]
MPWYIFALHKPPYPLFSLLPLVRKTPTTITQTNPVLKKNKRRQDHNTKDEMGQEVDIKKYGSLLPPAGDPGNQAQRISPEEQKQQLNILEALFTAKINAIDKAARDAQHKHAAKVGADKKMEECRTLAEWRIRNTKPKFRSLHKFFAWLRAAKEKTRELKEYTQGRNLALSGVSVFREETHKERTHKEENEMNKEEIRKEEIRKEGTSEGE